MREQLIKTLQSLDKPTRANLRKVLPDKEWVSTFGTFSQFKLAAGLSETKLEKQYYSQIAQCDNNYKLQQLNSKKYEYAEKYLRKNNNRFQTVVTAGDFHSELSDDFSVSVFLDAVKRITPEKLIINGDALDFGNLSTHGSLDPRRFTITQELQWLDNFLTNIREASPDSELIYNCGNHTARLLRHLASESPYVREILSDYHHFDFAKLLGLDKFEVNFISKDNLVVYQEQRSRKEIDKNFVILYEFFAIGHTQEVRKHGLPCVWSHNHTYKTFDNYDYRFGAYHNVQTGCMCVKDSNYCESSHWSNGFLITHVDTEKKTFQNEYVDCSNDFCMMGGLFYERS